MRLAPLRGGRKVEVQMSPLIDVVFLLLLFYAVTTQFVNDERLKLKLPEAETAESVGTNRDEKPPEVKVAVDGTIWINDEIVPESELETRMRQIVERAPDDGIILKGDKGADYGVVVHVLDVARKVGAKGIQMSADRPKEKIEFCPSPCPCSEHPSTKISFGALVATCRAFTNTHPGTETETETWAREAPRIHVIQLPASTTECSRRGVERAPRDRASED